MLPAALLLCGAVPAAAAQAARLATFGGEAGTTFSWQEQNDPVMGGQSVGTFQVSNGTGVFDGEVKTVPSLKAPGFTKMQAKGTFADVSALLGGAAPALTGGFQLTVRTSTPQYTGFKLSFGPANKKLSFFNEYKAPFSVPAGAGWQQVTIPFGDFSQDWSSYTGACDTKDPNILGTQHHCCTSEHPENCPTAARLGEISMMSIWAEGAAGKYHLEVKSIGAFASAPKCQNIVALAEGVPDLSTLVKAVVAGGLAGTLSGKGPFTVFAPTNEAFAALPAGTLDHLLQPANKKELDDILTYHVLGAKVLSADLKDGEKAATLEGKSVTVHVGKGGIKINTASVVTADVAACNGVVHVIDQVLSVPAAQAVMFAPPAPKCQNIVALAEGVADLSTLVKAVVAGGLAGTLSGKGPFTVFAPTNEAFAALPAGTLDHLLQPANKKELDDILTYHVLGAKVLSSDLKDGERAATLEGKSVTVHVGKGGIKINTASVVTADVAACNGVVHVIDQVLSVPAAVA